MKALKLLTFLAGSAIVLFVTVAIVSDDGHSDERAHERLVIENCWKQEGRKSFSPETARFIAAACEKLEDDYRAKWNREP